MNRPATCAVLAASFSLTTFSQNLIDWSKISGGSETSTNAHYSLSGTIGQPDAGGLMTNGQYFLTGGFWVLPESVQSAGAPMLTISKGTPGFATISWTPNAPGWTLQESLSLAGGWTNAATGLTNPAVVPAVPPRKFFRLFRP